MDYKNIIVLMVGALVGVLILSTFVPIIGATQENIGESVTLDQDYDSTYVPEHNLWQGEDLTITWVKADRTFTVNDDTITLSDKRRILIASNDFAVRSAGTSGNPLVATNRINQISNSDASFTLTVTDGEYSLTVGTDTAMTGTIEWLVYPVSENGNIQVVQPTDVSSFMTDKNSDIIILGNVYTTGDNDTFYSYYNGDLTVNDAYADVSSVTIHKTIKSGYTDIYDTSITVNVGDESFTPYYMLVPKTVSGHEASGALYEVIGLIPLVAGLGLLLLVCVEVFRRYY